MKIKVKAGASASANRTSPTAGHYVTPKNDDGSAAGPTQWVPDAPYEDPNPPRPPDIPDWWWKQHPPPALPKLLYIKRTGDDRGCALDNNGYCSTCVVESVDISAADGKPESSTLPLNCKIDYFGPYANEDDRANAKIPGRDYAWSANPGQLIYRRKWGRVDPAISLETILEVFGERTEARKTTDIAPLTGGLLEDGDKPAAIVFLHPQLTQCYTTKWWIKRKAHYDAACSNNSYYNAGTSIEFLELVDTPEDYTWFREYEAAFFGPYDSLALAKAAKVEGIHYGWGLSWDTPHAQGRFYYLYAADGWSEPNCTGDERPTTYHQCGRSIAELCPEGCKPLGNVTLRLIDGPSVTSCTSLTVFPLNMPECALI